MLRKIENHRKTAYVQLSSNPVVFSEHILHFTSVARQTGDKKEQNNIYFQKPVP